MQLALLNTLESFEKEPGFTDLNDFSQSRKPQLDASNPDA